MNINQLASEIAEAIAADFQNTDSTDHVKGHIQAVAEYQIRTRMNAFSSYVTELVGDEIQRRIKRGDLKEVEYEETFEDED